MIELRKVNKRWGKTRVIETLTVSISRGVIGILGHNGSGKSTLLELLAGVTYPDSGEITFWGKSYRTYELEIKNKLGFAPQSPPLYPNLTIQEYLLFCAWLKNIAPKAHIAQKIEEVIDQFKLETQRYKLLGQLSKGFRQRVSLAQSVLNDPECLILDEPTSGLDVESRQEIHRWIEEWGKTKIVILATHDEKEIATLCTQKIQLGTTV